MKLKASKAKCLIKSKVGLPALLFSSATFFLVGLSISNLIFLDVSSRGSSRSRARKLQSVKPEYHLLPPGKTGDDSITLIPFQVLSWKPRALYFPNFATLEQCRSIINMAKPSLTPSTLALRKGELEADTTGIRTSSGMFVSASEDESGILDAIEEKIAKVTMIPRTHGEAFNVLRYEIGQKYDSHYDAFNEAEYGPQKSQRVATFLLYLSDVEEGGATMFPFENGLDLENYNFQKCMGMQLKPRLGDGLLFYSVHPNSTIDVMSLHGSCPVIKGEKWVATKWIRNEEMHN
ncbi:2-oxoglutarate (2OG) and Fe(II)-dependent oxygenase superfamily protein [Euphorbia peplus]|nr:2-oxoglutarate (2OG) and Fe(II)-dependent oxygenase superfamily protein [Euphorbia peplus]